MRTERFLQRPTAAALSLTFALYAAACNGSSVSKQPTGSGGTVATGGGSGGAPGSGGHSTGGSSAISMGGSGGTSSATGGSNSTGTGGVASGGASGLTGSSGGSAGGDSGGSDASAGGRGSGGIVDGTGGRGSGGNSDAGTTTVDTASDSSPPVYDPCPTNGSACKIQPFGDSITQGFVNTQIWASGGGYRSWLFHDALADHKKITLVGALSDGPDKVDGVSFPKTHEGHFAWNLDQLNGLLPNAIASQSPHIVLVHAGTNNRDGSATDAAAKLATLVDKIIAAAPNALILLAQIIPVGDNGKEDAFVKAYNALMPAMVDARAKAGKHIQLVDQYTSFDVATMFPPAPNNSLHPSQVGYNHMGDVWYAAIKSMLP